MQIDISLPTDSGSEYGIDSVSLWLKQLELAVHHAQKSLKEMDTMIRERDKDGSPALTAYLKIYGFDSDGDDNSSGSANRVEIRIFEG